ncbi:MAG: winged helix family transcriptional regulator [Actinobacteria bacterium]|nr:winged helix family transcriptional regulator [Actinomycetota bacterium]
MSVALKTQTEIKGFALYVGVSEADAEAAGVSLQEIAVALKQRIAELVPDKANETYATVALAPADAPGRNLDIVRIALQEPRATKQKSEPVQEEERAAKGIVVDLTRRRLFVDGRNALLTCKEFELLAFLIENTGNTVTRDEIASIADRCGEPTPNARTIDVHVRRLRSKIAGYEDIVRTVRGQGYRFDKHPDVLIEEL